jgi:hypothetical protein
MRVRADADEKMYVPAGAFQGMSPEKKVSGKSMSQIASHTACAKLPVSSTFRLSSTVQLTRE